MDKDIEFEYKKEHLKRLIFNGFVSALHSHKTLFKSAFSENNTHSLTIALAYLSEAHNYHLNAETFVVDNLELFGDRNEFELLFQRFSVYNNEFLTNSRTDHSHQWSDIEFRSYVNSFKSVASLLNIDKDQFWINKALSEDDE